MILFCCHLWQSKQDLPFKLQFGKTKSENIVCCLKFLAVLCLAPLAELLSLSLFIYCFTFPNNENQVGWKPSQHQEFSLFFQFKYHFLWKQYKTIAGTFCASITMVMVTYMYLTGVLPPPW